VAHKYVFNPPKIRFQSTLRPRSSIHPPTPTSSSSNSTPTRIHSKLGRRRPRLLPLLVQGSRHLPRRGAWRGSSSRRTQRRDEAMVGQAKDGQPCTGAAVPMVEGPPPLTLHHHHPSRRRAAHMNDQSYCGHAA
jgi:hypothetical protein